MPATDAIETMAPLPVRAHALDRLGGAEEHAGEVRVEHRVPVGVAHLLRERHPLDAGIVDQHVDAAGVAVDRREGCGDAGSVRDVAAEIGDAGVARVRLAEVERKHGRALVAELERDGFADAAGGAGDDRDLAFKCRIGSHGGRP